MEGDEHLSVAEGTHAWLRLQTPTFCSGRLYTTREIQQIVGKERWKSGCSGFRGGLVECEKWLSKRIDQIQQQIDAFP